MGRRSDTTISTKLMATLSMETQRTLSLLTFESFLPFQFQHIHEEEELDDEENIECNSVREQNSKEKN